MITCTRMAGKHWIVLYISSHLSSMPCLSFTKKQSAWQQRQCKVCKETWPTRSCLNSDSYTCYQCKRDKGSPKLLSAENDMDPGPVLLCLEGLTQVEQMLIARGCPVMCVYRKMGGQCGYRNHVLNFPHSLPTYAGRTQYVSRLPGSPTKSWASPLLLARVSRCCYEFISGPRLLNSSGWIVN